MKKIVILGIGNAQVDILKLLHNSGNYEVHALSYSDDGRGLKYVDQFALVDITDKEKVKKYCQDKAIDVVYSVGSDVAMPTVAYVSEQLGLPHFVSYETALSCNNKDLFREKLKHCVGSVPFIVMESESTNVDLSFPLFVKPVDSQGQRGVTTAHNEEELKASFRNAIQYSRAGKVIAEKKIEGEEISVNAYVVDGELKFFLPSGRVSWAMFDGGIIHKHILPSALSTLANENVKALVLDTVQALQITNGPVYFQIKMEEETPYLIEVTPRLDGCHMWRLINESCGVNLLNIALEHLLEGDVTIPTTYETKDMCLEFYCQPPAETFEVPGITGKEVYRELYYGAGDAVKRMNGKMEKCGYCIFPLV
ncbi:ATP-grasp domain-containing protein [Vibrio owensii]|uniref:ATP-grasp domain-containing protein n=1 Tax=Vibrio owensii TaxID=696485 RepID=UPI0005EF47DB|nr:ATP-grasp domain-containing protein [Vibrio owensii]